MQGRFLLNVDPREVINRSEMSITQMLVIFIMLILNSLDGFDILSISFASNGIKDYWKEVDDKVLGYALAMELIGMGLGSYFLGKMADKIGRRPTALYCLIIMALGMLMAARSGTIITLCFWRIFTGLGIGGLLTAVTALSAEYSSFRRRHLCISLMAIGYPLGGIVYGSIAKILLSQYDWRSIFYLGASMTALSIPVVYFFVPESIHWLTQKQPAGSLEKINRILRKCRRSVISSLPQLSESAQSASSKEIFSPALLKTTVIIATSYFFHIMTYYLILKWSPRFAAAMLTLQWHPTTPAEKAAVAAAAGGVLVWANVGGALGGTLFGFLTLKFDLKKMSIGILFFAAVSIAVYGFTPSDLRAMSLLCMVAGFFGNSGIIALYTVVAHAYPTHARAFGTGFMLAVGRGGAILSPILVGYMYNSGMPLPYLGAIMCIGSLVGAIVLLFIRLKSGDYHDGLQTGKTEPIPERAAA
jgi:benzoate transport